MSTINKQDYSLVGKNSAAAVDSGLAGADWYTSPVTRAQLKVLLTRKDWPAIRDTVIWFSLLIGFGVWGALWWGSWLAIIPFAGYGLIYASSSDARWHESSHGTAFKTDWLNELLYEISSFMVLRESVPWRWSHTRHHSDTIIVGRDPEIAVPRPPDIKALILSFFNLKAWPNYIKNIFLHSFGKLGAEEKTYIPEDQYNATFIRARIYLAIYATAISLCFYHQSILPLMFVGLPNLYGAWLMPIYGYTQHTGLAENVLDHRLNCRTIYMNPINRFLYWNMNYHTEHHMFPLVPYHQLPKLHQLIKADCPTPYSGLVEAYREIIPAVKKQIHDPTHYVKRKLPHSKLPHSSAESANPADGQAQTFRSEATATADGWVEVCDAAHLGQEDVIRFDHNHHTYAIYQSKEGSYHATAGICTHGNTHLAEGLVKGNLIECPKHNGRFNFKDGTPARKPVCTALKTYSVKMEAGALWINTAMVTGCSMKQPEKIYHFKVITNKNVSTFIRELVIEPLGGTKLDYKPGGYLQFNIPEFENISLADMQIDAPYAETWENLAKDNIKPASNKIPARRNYSLASNPKKDTQLKFNIRIALPPQGSEHPLGSGSSYMHRLHPGDEISAHGPFGDFHIKETENEMVYLGGGAGMAPLRSHISYLLESQNSTRKISLWYGARSSQELFYDDYFEALAKKHPNFSFHVALSDPEENSVLPSGFIHQHLNDNYLKQHENVSEIEFYLCGPPPMIKASSTMLKEFNVPDENIAFDEFS